MQRLDHPGITMQALAETMVMDRTAALRAIQPLTRDKLVQLKPAPDLARKQSLSLTADGESKLSEAEARWQDAQAEFEASFGRDEAAALRKVLLSIKSDRT